MKKRGQVVIFIILALFVVVSILLFMLIPRNIEKIPTPDSDKIYFYINDLIEDGAFECLKQVGMQGGYFEIPTQVYVDETAYWYYEGVSTQPLIDTIENETATCINKFLEDSTNMILEKFGNESLKLNQNKISSKVRIGEWRTIVDVEYSLTIMDGDSGSTISDFKVEYKINLLKLYELATGIVNYASVPEFDKCNPSTNCYGENINFTFFNEGENLFIKGQTFAIFSDETKEEEYELNFAIKRPIKEAFMGDGKKMAVLYADDSDYRNFGASSLEVFENIDLNEGVDYYDCEDIEEFISKIDSYDIVVITGGMQYQVRKKTIFNGDTGESEDSYSDSVGELFSGCNAFGPPERKMVLKNWVNRGGLLWIGGVGKLEADSYEISYLGSLGYKSVGWQWEISLDDIENRILEDAEEGRYTVGREDIIQSSNVLINCPNDISKEIVGAWGFFKISITPLDEIIIGNIDNPSLWTRKLGSGEIVFDNFILKDNIYEKLEYDDDLYSKGLAEKYFVNILNYLTKFENYEKTELKLSLGSPINGEEVETSNLYFKSEFGVNSTYELFTTDRSGVVNSIELEEKDITKDRFSSDLFKITLNNYTIWENLNDGLYEWQIGSNGLFSDIGFFFKNNSIESIEIIEEEVINEN